MSSSNTAVVTSSNTNTFAPAAWADLSSNDQVLYSNYFYQLLNEVGLRGYVTRHGGVRPYDVQVAISGAELPLKEGLILQLFAIGFVIKIDRVETLTVVTKTGV